jgi:hypothetical protein
MMTEHDVRKASSLIIQQDQLLRLKQCPSGRHRRQTWQTNVPLSLTDATGLLKGQAGRQHTGNGRAAKLEPTARTQASAMVAVAITARING